MDSSISRIKNLFIYKGTIHGLSEMHVEGDKPEAADMENQ